MEKFEGWFYEFRLGRWIATIPTPTYVLKQLATLPLLKMSKKKKLKSGTVSYRSKSKKLKSVSANLECGECGNRDFECTKGTLTSDLSCARCGAEFGFVSIQFLDCLGWAVSYKQEKN